MNRAIWPMPLLLAGLTLFGLLLALTGDGWRDALAALCVAAPLAAIGWAVRRRT